MRTAADNRKISLLLKMEREGSLIPTPEFQRRAVWTNPDKVAFIETILQGYPFPEIYTAVGDVDTTSGEATELLVDGQQRLRTIKDYFNGVSPFKNSRSITRYKDLEEEDKKKFLNYDVAIRNLGILDEVDIREVFKRMNRTSYSLNDMERFNAVYLGEYKKFSEMIAKDTFFLEKKIFSPNDIRRMKDVVYVASLVATMMSDYFHRDDEVEEYLERYNEEFTDKTALYARVNSTLAYIRGLQLPVGSRAFKKTEFYTLFVEVDRQLHVVKSKPDPDSVRQALETFFAKVDAARAGGTDDPSVASYLASIVQNTADRSARIARGNSLRELLQNVDQEQLPEEEPCVDEAALAAELDKVGDDAESDDFYTD